MEELGNGDGDFPERARLPPRAAAGCDGTDGNNGRQSPARGSPPTKRGEANGAVTTPSARRVGAVATGAPPVSMKSGHLPSRRALSSVQVERKARTASTRINGVPSSVERTPIQQGMALYYLWQADQQGSSVSVVVWVGATDRSKEELHNSNGHGVEMEELGNGDGDSLKGDDVSPRAAAGVGEGSSRHRAAAMAVSGGSPTTTAAKQNGAVTSIGGDDWAVADPGTSPVSMKSGHLSPSRCLSPRKGPAPQRGRAASKGASTERGLLRRAEHPKPQGMAYTTYGRAVKKEQL
nr:hypothetical protein Iba_chr13fCG5360 [Ipomoea batatas]